MNRISNIVLAALFLSAVAVMYLLAGKYLPAYLAGEAAIAISAAFRARLPIQAAGLSLTLLFALTSIPTLPLLLLSVLFVGIFIYGVNFFGYLPWRRVETPFQGSGGGRAVLSNISEISAVGIAIFLLSLMASVFSGLTSVRANGIIVFLFMISIGLLLLAFVSAYIAER